MATCISIARARDDVPPAPHARNARDRGGPAAHPRLRRSPRDDQTARRRRDTTRDRRRFSVARPAHSHARNGTSASRIARVRPRGRQPPPDRARRFDPANAVCCSTGGLGHTARDSAVLQVQDWSAGFSAPASSGTTRSRRAHGAAGRVLDARTASAPVRALVASVVFTVRRQSTAVTGGANFDSARVAVLSGGPRSPHCP